MYPLALGPRGKTASTDDTSYEWQNAEIDRNSRVAAVKTIPVHHQVYDLGTRRVPETLDLLGLN